MKISLMKCLGFANVIFKAVCRIPRLANSMDQSQGPNSVDVGPKPRSRPNWYHYLKKLLTGGRLHQLSSDPSHACLGRKAQKYCFGPSPNVYGAKEPFVSVHHAYQFLFFRAPSRRKVMPRSLADSLINANSISKQIRCKRMEKRPMQLPMSTDWCDL